MKKYILGFLTSAIIFGSIGVIANNISATNIVYNDTTVKDALDSLYTKVKPDYTGATTVTPTTASQTLETNNKILKSNITINAIPATYKNLTTTTTATANDILNERKAYNNSGSLITGNINTDCINGIIICNNACTGSQGIKIADFTPSFLLTKYRNVANTSYIYNIYNPSISTTNHVVFSYNSSKTQISNMGYDLSNGVTIKNWGNDFYGRTVYYMICK